MAYMTVTFTDTTKGPFNLLTLWKAAIAGSLPAGVTVTPATPATPPRIAAQLPIQNDENSAGTLYVSTDASALPTAGGGVGQKLDPGGATEFLNQPLTGVYLSASANSTIANILAEGGFQ